MGQVFNSANNIKGFYQTYKGGNVAISVYRKSAGSGNNSGAGFMVSNYTVTFQRSVVLQRFLNIKDSVAIVGAGVGTIQLTGLVGKLQDFEDLLGNSNKAAEDICNPLIVRIEDSSSFEDCKSGASPKGSIVCGNCIVTLVNLTGNIDQGGVVMQQGSLTLQFNELEIK